MKNQVILEIIRTVITQKGIGLFEFTKQMKVLHNYNDKQAFML